MSQGWFESFAGRRVLLLQGPMGSFFRRLSQDLSLAGAQVFKVNFNGGDWLFYPTGAMNYRAPMSQWPAWLQTRLEDLQIDLILLFGDCRPVHQAALRVARKLGIEVGVFEEGYIRPNFVTLERLGVNGHSTLPRTSAHYAAKDSGPPAAEHPVGHTFSAMAWQAVSYGLAAWLGRIAFRHYTHHRPIGVQEALRWVRSGWRKAWYGWHERGHLDILRIQADHRYFLVPLQVFNDSQVQVHAQFRDVAQFIEHVVRSFAQHAPADTLLVLKHHPMDRGHVDYTRLIRALAQTHQVLRRVVYLHDQHLPTLLRHARGVVVINSTAGMAALHHGVPTLACGSAVYDLPDLTYQGSLDDFWIAAPYAAPDPVLYRQFRGYLIESTQLNGSFYRPLGVAETRSGLVWPQVPLLTLDARSDAPSRERASPKMRATVPSLTP